MKGDISVSDNARSERSSTAFRAIRIVKCNAGLFQDRIMWQRNMSSERVEHIVLVKLGMCQLCERCVSCDFWHGQKRVWKSASEM
jgi:hypothetical protein